MPVLVEEFIKTETGEYELPIEYKCHVFGETVGAIEVIRRLDDTGEGASLYRAMAVV